MENSQVIPVLDPIRHARIIQDFQDVCMVAGVQGKYLHESMVNYCRKVKVEWERSNYVIFRDWV
jgi:hypothetical protein